MNERILIECVTNYIKKLSKKKNKSANLNSTLRCYLFIYLLVYTYTTRTVYSIKASRHSFIHPLAAKQPKLSIPRSLPRKNRILIILRILTSTLHAVNYLFIYL